MAGGAGSPFPYVDSHVLRFPYTAVTRRLNPRRDRYRVLTQPNPAFQEQMRQAYTEIGAVKRTPQRLCVSKDMVRNILSFAIETNVNAIN